MCEPCYWPKMIELKANESIASRRGIEEALWSPRHPPALIGVNKQGKYLFAAVHLIPANCAVPERRHCIPAILSPR